MLVPNDSHSVKCLKLIKKLTIANEVQVVFPSCAVGNCTQVYFLDYKYLPKTYRQRKFKKENLV